MNKEILQDIEITLNANKDYKEHYHLNDYFEVEYIDKLVIAYKQLQNNWNELKKWLEFMIKQEREGKTVYISLKDILNKMQELEQGKDE